MFSGGRERVHWYRMGLSKSSRVTGFDQREVMEAEMRFKVTLSFSLF